MERLTGIISYCSFTYCDNEGKCKIENICYDKQLYEKLKNFEDLEEQGLLLKLPCKIGDTVYRILDNIYEFEVTCIRLYEDKMLLDIENSDIGMGFSLDANRLSKNLFLTYEEAEKALAEMGE